MTLETWIAFTIASAAVVLIPGPNIILTINYALRGGRRTGWATVPGVVAGAFVAMTLSLLGAGAILAASAFLFTLLKLAGAVYLMWLAYVLWTAPAEEISLETGAAGQTMRTMLSRAFLISVLNPKGPAFYMAFVPQFVTASEPLLPQFAILVTTFLVVATLNSLLWLFFTSALRPYLRRPRAIRAVNRTGAGCLFSAGVFTAGASRSG